jgi:hypothetical protein
LHVTAAGRVAHPTFAAAVMSLASAGLVGSTSRWIVRRWWPSPGVSGLGDRGGQPCGPFVTTTMDRNEPDREIEPVHCE